MSETQSEFERRSDLASGRECVTQLITLITHKHTHSGLHESVKPSANITVVYFVFFPFYYFTFGVKGFYICPKI